jgi:NADH dehydrogenase
MGANIPSSNLERVVILGGGFAGIELAKKLSSKKYQIVLLDKNNYHQFQPLFYQVATAGLEPSAISFPFRKLFQKNKQFHFRMTSVEGVDTANQEVYTDIGVIKYDKLVVAMGATTNFYNNAQIEANVLPLKSTAEALNLRNTLFNTFEKALLESDIAKRKALLTVVIVGGGATGVEVSGSLADMRKLILPKDYPEINFDEMEIYLVDGAERLLSGMKEHASQKAKEYLQKLGIQLIQKAHVTSYDGSTLVLGNGEAIETHTVIWAAGVKANALKGIEPELILPNNRISVNEYNQVNSYSNVFALGDIASMSSDVPYPKGHPQVAQVAIQQARFLARNLNEQKQSSWKKFTYKDLGSMATIGRNLAVVEFPKMKFTGFFAWCIWMFVHLISLIGTKNKVQTFLNWVWNYFTYDQSLRLILSPKKEEKINVDSEK